MTWIAVAVGGGALLGGVASSIGSSNAASSQANASEQAAQIQQNEFNTITQQETPYMQSGYGALSALDYGLGINPESSNGTAIAPPGSSGVTGSWGAANPTANMGGLMGGTLGSLAGGPSGSSAGSGGYGSLTAPFTAADMQQYSPAYQFQMEQGQQGTLNGSASGQGALSGAAQQALVGFNQNYANTAFNNAFNQYQTQQGNTYNRLSGIAQLGQTSAANTGQQGTSLAATTGQAISNIGTAQAGGDVGIANSIGGTLSTLGALGAYEGSGASQLTPYTVTGAGASYM